MSVRMMQTEVPPVNNPVSTMSPGMQDVMAARADDVADKPSRMESERVLLQRSAGGSVKDAPSSIVAILRSVVTKPSPCLYEA